MASIQIPNLTAAISVSGAEQMEAVQGGSSVRVTIQQIADLAGSQYGLTPIPDLTLLGNLSGVSALPTSYTLSQFLDSSFSNTQGAVIYRGPSSWQALAPGANGQVLRTNGTGADVSWYTVPGGGTVQSITAGTNLSVSGSANPITLAGTINTVMNPTFTTSVTTPSIYGGSSASQTLLIQSTTGVGTSDSIVFKVGNNGAITAMTIASDGTVTIPQAAIDTTSITVPLLIGGTTASSSLTLKSTSGVGTTDSILMKVGNNGAVTALTIASNGNATFLSTSTTTIGTLSLTNALTVGNGGTGATTLTLNGVLYGNATSAVGVTAAGTTGQVLVATTGSAPSWSSTIPSTAGVTSISFGTTGLTPSTATTGAITVAGTLVAANGGTGQSSYTIGDLLYASGTTALSKLADVAVGSVLVSGGVGTAPAYSSSPTISTSVTTPMVIGGTTASSTLTLESTSGAGTSDYIAFLTGSQTERMRIRSDGNVSIGGSGAASTSLYLQKDLSVATSYGVFQSGQFQSSVTNGYSFNSSANVATGATLTALSHFRATEGTISGTITTQTGFDAVSDLISATNNFAFRAQNTAAVTAGKTAYGFLSNINTATGGGTTYGFYAAGTANNYFGGNVGIGSTSLTSTNLAIGANITGGTTAYAQLNSGVIQSGVTGTAGSFVSNMSSAAAAFTTTSAIHFQASPNAGGAGSTITNQYGFLASDNLSTAGAATVTNAYGFYGNIGSATNRWNLYMAGTANNYMAGNLGIGNTGSLSANNLVVGANITGSVASSAIFLNGTAQSDVTTSLIGVYSAIKSAAAAFTTTNAIHFYVNPATGGAGSTITNQVGFHAESTIGTAGAATITNAYGFYGNIAAATNKYNLYTNGTANNYFGGYSFGLGGVQNSTTATATNTATLTATQVASGFIVGTPTATASYTLPTAAALDTELSNSPTGTNFELIVFTTAAFAITILTATGWTLVGSMATGATANSFARFRARKTGAGAWTLYRVS